jgi:hypothetical protein
MKLVAAVVPLALAACAIERVDPPTPPTPPAELTDRLDGVPEASSAPRGRLLAAGAGVLPLEVTDDDYAIYQDGVQVFAVALAGGPRQLIGESPAGVTAFVYRVGRVAFVWTNPDRTLANFGVSPLVIWSAATGPHLATQSSAVGTFAASSTRRGDFVIFPSNSTADGTVGDLVYASTDLRHQTTLVAGAQMGFAVGPCNPLATFIGAHDDEDDDPIAVYCTTDPSTATLSRWTHGTRRDLVAAAFAPPSLAVDPDTGRALTLAAGSRNPLLVDPHGRVTTVASASGRIPSFGPDGTIYYATRSAPAPAPATMVRVHGGASQVVGDLQAIYNFSFGSRSFTTPLTSPDGRSFLVVTATDPSTGFGNVVRLDARGGGPVTIDASLENAQFGPPFTERSEFALFAHGDPTFTVFVGPLFAADCHGARQFSEDTAWSYLAGAGNLVVYNDNTVLDPTNFFLHTTADLKIVDVGRATLASRMIAPQANATFFVTQHGAAVVYTTDHDARPGLYVADAL